MKSVVASLCACLFLQIKQAMIGAYFVGVRLQPLPPGFKRPPNSSPPTSGPMSVLSTHLVHLVFEGDARKAARMIQDACAAMAGALLVVLPVVACNPPQSEQAAPANTTKCAPPGACSAPILGEPLEASSGLALPPPPPPTSAFLRSPTSCGDLEVPHTQAGTTPSVDSSPPMAALSAPPLPEDGGAHDSSHPPFTAVFDAHVGFPTSDASYVCQGGQRGGAVTSPLKWSHNASRGSVPSTRPPHPTTSSAHEGALSTSQLMSLTTPQHLACAAKHATMLGHILRSSSCSVDSYASNSTLMSDATALPEPTHLHPAWKGAFTHHHPHSHGSTSTHQSGEQLHAWALHRQGAQSMPEVREATWGEGGLSEVGLTAPLSASSVRWGMETVDVAAPALHLAHTMTTSQSPRGAPPVYASAHGLHLRPTTAGSHARWADRRGHMTEGGHTYMEGCYGDAGGLEAATPSSTVRALVHSFYSSVYGSDWRRKITPVSNQSNGATVQQGTSACSCHYDVQRHASYEAPAMVTTAPPNHPRTPLRTQQPVAAMASHPPRPTLTPAWEGGMGAAAAARHAYFSAQPEDEPWCVPGHTLPPMVRLLHNRPCMGGPWQPGSSAAPGSHLEVSRSSRVAPV